MNFYTKNSENMLDILQAFNKLGTDTINYMYLKELIINLTFAQKVDARNKPKIQIALQMNVYIELMPYTIIFPSCS